ncbi:MAG TPA: branched-chain amino acid ABC transporter substrate-binding protein, partial [Paracoccaceae bacterium]|nr:branched-chain amino acid ABC transporter substrate-binding protein [Paracoccaceae bacterium]
MRWNFLRAAMVGLVWCTAAQAEVTLNVGYLSAFEAAPPTLSNLDPEPADIGLAGARTGLADNATTGRFLGHSYDLTARMLDEGDDPLAAAADLLAQSPFLILDAPSDVLMAIADLPQAQGAILFNAAAGDLALRSADCSGNLLHSIPSDAMRTDALAQF